MNLEEIGNYVKKLYLEEFFSAKSIAEKVSLKQGEVLFLLGYLNVPFRTAKEAMKLSMERRMKEQDEKKPPKELLEKQLNEEGALSRVKAKYYTPGPAPYTLVRWIDEYGITYQRKRVSYLNRDEKARKLLEKINQTIQN